MNNDQLRQEIEELFDSRCQYDDEGVPGVRQPGHEFKEEWFCQDCFYRDIAALIESEKKKAVEEAYERKKTLPNGGLMEEQELEAAVIAEMFPTSK